MDSDVVNAIGVPALDSFRAMVKSGYATGGYVGNDIATRPSVAIAGLSNDIASMNIAVAVTDIQRGEYNYARVTDIANR